MGNCRGFAVALGLKDFACRLLRCIAFTSPIDAVV